MKYFFLLFLSIQVASAHGNATSDTQTINNYDVEFEYNKQGNIKSGEGSIFTVFLLDSEGNPVTFQKAYVKISAPNGVPVLFGNLTEDPDTKGSARIGGILNDEGEYTATVQFTKNGTVIGPLDYKFNVENPQNANASSDGEEGYKNWVLSILGIVGLAAVIFILRSKLPYRS